ncbi:hypothetical protein RHSIM_Rhsim01G0071700 [Rhododendron simsii]|uniref:ABC-2 type transporter transmembrane domain-containing protein n=1 Tax=Rhododendron simsii TaxID=118357 RepID=A0A834HEM9_RHOSS|nr:hypothetical protein RHSIM_Rhsim01G0071700 [Rhododendron simsii]
MKTSSWPKPNSKTTPYSNFFTFFDHPDLYHGTTLNKRPKIGHGDDTTLNNSPKTNDTEPSETSPFKGIHSTSLSANETNEDHNRIVGFFLGWDQKDRTLPEGPPSPNGSDTSVSVGSNTHIITSVSVATRQLLDIEGENSILRAQVVELSHRLQSLNEILRQEMQIARIGKRRFIKRTKQQDLMNLLGAMYAAVIFLGATNASSVQSIVAIERTVFYRESAAGMYSELPYAFAQVISYRYLMGKEL